MVVDFAQLKVVWYQTVYPLSMHDYLHSTRIICGLLPRRLSMKTLSVLFLHKTINLLCCVNHYTKLLSIVSGVGFTFNHLLRPVKTTGTAASSLSSSIVLLSFSLQLSRYE